MWQCAAMAMYSAKTVQESWQSRKLAFNVVLYRAWPWKVVRAHLRKLKFVTFYPRPPFDYGSVSELKRRSRLLVWMIWSAARSATLLPSSRIRRRGCFAASTLNARGYPVVLAKEKIMSRRAAWVSDTRLFHCICILLTTLHLALIIRARDRSEREKYSRSRGAALGCPHAKMSTTKVQHTNRKRRDGKEL